MLLKETELLYIQDSQKTFTQYIIHFWDLVPQGVSIATCLNMGLDKFMENRGYQQLLAW